MRIETELETKDGTQIGWNAWAASNMELTAAELENLLRNIDQRDLVAPLREEQLRGLTQEMELFARQHGMEHLL